MGLVGEGFEGIERSELKELETLDGCSAEVEVESCVVTVTVLVELLPESKSQYQTSSNRRKSLTGRLGRIDRNANTTAGRLHRAASCGCGCQLGYSGLHKIEGRDSSPW